MRACQNPSPVIDGRRANCNLASLGAQKTRPPTPQHGRSPFLFPFHFLLKVPSINSNMVFVLRFFCIAIPNEKEVKHSLYNVLIEMWM